MIYDLRINLILWVGLFKADYYIFVILNLFQDLFKIMLKPCRVAFKLP